MTIKKIISSIISVCIILSLTVSSYAGTTDSIINEVRAIARNAPARFTPTAHWSADDIQFVKETPLYNLYDELCAYCIDLKNSSTDEIAYLLISTDRTDFPIIGYSPFSESPYYSVSEDKKAVFLSVNHYYIEDEEEYISILGDETICKSDVTGGASSISSPGSFTDYTNVREMFINAQFPANVARAGVSEKNLTSVPCWKWAYGCCPTSMGMIIAYHYGGSESTLPFTLSNYMNTNGGGTTYWNKVFSGTLNYLDDLGVTPTTCGWYDSSILGYPSWGIENNPKNVFKAQIDAGNPVFVACENATMTSTGYPNGFGDHAMTGVGYRFSEVDGDYIILHTTYKGDNDFYASIESSSFSRFAWGVLEP